MLETERNKNLLVKCVESRNEHLFEHILHEHTIDPNEQLECFGGLSTFEKVLKQPNSRRLIEICIRNECTFYKQNPHGIYPIRYAIESLCSGNLKALLKSFKADSLGDDNFLAAQNFAIINEMDGGSNYLHKLISPLTKDNYQELSNMIMAMVINGCNVNLQNKEHETPFYLLVKNPIVDNDLIDFVIDKAQIDFYAFDSKEIISLMEKRGRAARLSIRNDFVVDKNYMTQHIGNWNSGQLHVNLKFLKENSNNDFDNEMLDLLDVAIARNLPETVEILVGMGVELNRIPKNSKFGMAPGFLACALGHHQVLDVLLTSSSLLFESSEPKGNLLHQILSKSINFSDRQRLFDLIIDDDRCDRNIINQTNSENRVPLFLACQYEYDDIVKELLRNGAYIGHESVLNCIKKDTLAEFLDECVKCSEDIHHRECEIKINYKFLWPYDPGTPETTSVRLISSNHTLQNFILHPVIMSFVFLKWRKIDYIVYFNMLLYFGFMIFLVFIVVNFYYVSGKIKYDNEFCQANVNILSEYIFESKTLSSNSSRNTFTHLLFENLETFKNLKKNYTYEAFMDRHIYYKDKEWETRFRQYFREHSLSYWVGIFGLVLLAVYEVVQCVVSDAFEIRGSFCKSTARSCKRYFSKPVNWLDISLIALSFFVLTKSADVGKDVFKQTCAIMILLMGAQSIQLFSKVSAFSLSLHMAILNKVCRTFLKTIAPYLIIISAFGMSFFALNYEDITATDANLERNYFSNPFLSTISTMRMMLSDFGAVTINEQDHFKGIIFLAFMISISIILFNLLNALAISDTHEMMKNAELVEITKRISTLRSYETLFSVLKLTFTKLFPRFKTILLTPNTNKYIQRKIRVEKDSADVTIEMQNTGNVIEYEQPNANTENLVKYEIINADWATCIRKFQPIQLDEKLINSILNCVKDRQQKDLLRDRDQIMKKIMNNIEHNKAQQDIQKTMNKILNTELCAIEKAQEDIYKELLKISNRVEYVLEKSCVHDHNSVGR